MYNPFLFANGNKGPYVLRDSVLPVFFLMILRQRGLGISGPALFAGWGVIVVGLSIYHQFIKKRESSVYGIPTWCYGLGLLLLALASYIL